MSSAIAGAPPLDIAHLEEQTMGNRALAREVLEMFLAQSRTLLASLGDPATRTADVAHKLVGSARGIGLPEVAARARTLEDGLRSGTTDGEAEFAALAVAVQAAFAFIRDYLVRMG